jgi:hypothetical protein
MNFKTKRKNKKYAKIYFILAYSMVIILFMVMTLMIVHVINISKLHSILLVLTLMLSPIILGMIFGFIGSLYYNERMMYKAKIKEYRQRKFFKQIINLIKVNNFKDATKIYNTLITEKEYKRFLYPYITAAAIYAYAYTQDDIERSRHGEEKLQTILDFYDPNKIEL